MQIIRIFYQVYMRGLDDRWNKLSAAIKKLPGVDTVMIVGQSEPFFAEAEICFNNSILSVDTLESEMKTLGAGVIQMNVHFPSAISHVSDAYGASAVSLNVIDGIKHVKAVSDAWISSSGVITVTIEADYRNKQNTINNIINAIESSK